MITLSFTVRNHKSIRDQVTLDLARPSLRTLRPKDGDWSSVTYPLTGIFGGNATGKSAVLDALKHTFLAIRDSATSWQADRSMRRHPFLLDGTVRESASLYELDFVHEGRRHLYGFEVDAGGIKREWLKDVPATRWRTLLDRDRERSSIKLHSSIRSVGRVTSRELVLSRALLLDHPQLRPIAEDLTSSFDLVSVKDSHRDQRLRGIADSLADKSIDFADIETLLQVADVGVTKVTLEEQNLPENVRTILARLDRELRDGVEGSGASESEREELDDEDSELVIRSLLLTHRGTSESPPFSIHQESDGTIAWLAIAVPALEVLRWGGLLCVDEIDASLHPHLLEVLLGVFADPLINSKQAQLVFTSHETYVLSPLSDVTLEPEQVWFTDKTYEGATALTCLADYPRHPDANVAKRYLLGRYGGTPRLSPSALASLVDTQVN